MMADHISKPGAQPLLIMQFFMQWIAIMNPYKLLLCSFGYHFLIQMGNHNHKLLNLATSQHPWFLKITFMWSCMCACAYVCVCMCLCARVCTP